MSRQKVFLVRELFLSLRKCFINQQRLKVEPDLKNSHNYSEVSLLSDLSSELHSVDLPS
jgi:hypothetical protein